MALLWVPEAACCSVVKTRTHLDAHPRRQSVPRMLRVPTASDMVVTQTQAPFLQRRKLRLRKPPLPCHADLQHSIVKKACPSAPHPKSYATDIPERSQLRRPCRWSKVPGRQWELWSPFSSAISLGCSEEAPRMGQGRNGQRSGWGRIGGDWKWLPQSLGAKLVLVR